MGKEPAKTLRITHKPKHLHRYNNIKAIREEFDNKWSSQQQIVNKDQITEDGRAFLYIHTRHKDTTVICTGISKKGNFYKDLLSQLLVNGLISSLSQIERIEVLIENGWEKVDVIKDTFKADDKIVIVLDDMIELREQKME